MIPSDGGPLVFVDDLVDPLLADDDHHHLARVRRLRDGDALILSDGTGGWRTARFSGSRPEPIGPVETAAAPTPSVGVAFALVKGARPELVVAKLTELGVDLIVPFEAARSVVRWDEERKTAAHARLVRVAREASMQSRRACMPTVAEVSTYAEVAKRVGACRADRGGGPPSLRHPLMLVGPEGGWDEQERRMDLPVVGLADGVLRAETAAIVAGAVLTQLRAGVIGESPGEVLSG